MNHYSQNDEQEFVLSFFGDRRGRLLDIGAYDGITFSNTRALLESGWSGVLVEPDPFNLIKLISNPPPNLEIICGAVSDRLDWAKLEIETQSDRKWASSISPDAVESEHVLNPSKAFVRIHTITLYELCLKNSFNFISIDAERMDFKILKSCPAEVLYSCDLLCIEPINLTERSQISSFMQMLGFVVCHETPENVLFKKLCQ